MTTPYQSALAKLAAMEAITEPMLAGPRFTPSEAAALLERLAWRPIETAPSGSEVLVRNGSIWIATKKGNEWRVFSPRGDFSINNPTHWQPLPEPPNE